MLPRRYLLAIAAVVDIALYARGQPVAAKELATRHRLTPRHLEPLLQDLVRTGFLKGLRGPRGGYELARERRRISAGDIVRALWKEPDETRDRDEGGDLVQNVVTPAIADALETFLNSLDGLTIEELCRQSDSMRRTQAEVASGEFHI